MRPRWLAPLVLGLLTALAYANAAPPALIFDDHIILVRDESFGGVRTLPHLFHQHARPAEPHSRLYRPVAMATLALDRSVYGAWARGYHLTSIALHVVATLLLFGFLVALGVPRPAAFVAALVFGVHPIHTEAVDQAFNRSEILATIGVVGGLWWLWRFLGRPALAAGGLAAIYFLALLCRESAVTLPALAALLLVLLRPAGGLRRELRRLAPLAVLLVPLAVYLWLRQLALDEPAGGITRSVAAGLAAPGALAERLALLAATGRDYLRMLVWPYPQRMTCNDYVVHGAGLAALLHVGLVGAAVVLRRRLPALAAGVGGFYVALLPSTRLFQDPAVLAERFVYLPSALACIALAFGLAALLARSGPRALGLLGVAVLAALAPLTLVRNLDWHSTRALWEAEVRVTQNDWQALLNLSQVYLTMGRSEDVLRLTARGQQVAPKNSGFYNNRAVALVKLGRYDEAEAQLRRAIALSGGFAQEYVNLARLHAMAGRLAEAEAEFGRAVELLRRDADRHAIRGEMLLRCRRDVAGARAEFAAALALEPHHLEALRGLAAAQHAAAAPPRPASTPASAPQGR